MDYRNTLKKLKKDLEKQDSITLELPHRFSFREHDIYEFDKALHFFDWSLKNRQVKIDMSKCLAPNYQTLSLLVLYAWYLKNQGCTVSFIESESEIGASSMWRNLGGRGTFPVLFNESQIFKGGKYKPLFPVRNSHDFKRVIQEADSYTKNFSIEFSHTLRYILSELLYNTIEHGVCFGGQSIRNKRIPSIAQFTWYQSKNEIHFIIADIGIGIKKHIEKAYPGIASDVDAISLAIKPKHSGTFYRNDPYTDKNNAGMGLFISTNIVRHLNADMHIISGSGLLHISPRDITRKTIDSHWPGTFVLVTLRLGSEGFSFEKMLQEFRDRVSKEQSEAEKREKHNTFHIPINNFFGSYAEDKEAAIKFKEKYLFEKIDENMEIVLDFLDVNSAPHSFLSALLASPIKRLGMSAYKRIKIINATSDIRETIDFILDDNTEG